MFDPKAFTAPKTTEVILGNNAHPVMDHIVGGSMKKIPSKNPRYDGLFYVFLKEDKGVITYDGETLQFHPTTRDGFKLTVKNGEPLGSPCEPVTPDPRNKHLGNDLLGIIKDELD